MKNLDRKSLMKKLALVGVLSVFLLSVCFAYISVKKILQTSHNTIYTIVIDAGHGGIDGGVSGKTTGVKESDLNLEISKKLKSLFEKAGVKVVMTRTGYGGLYGAFSKGFKMRDMKARVKIINSANADAFVSVHLNYYQDLSRRGATVFFGNDEKSKNLANSIQTFFNTSSGQPRQLSALKGDYYLLNTANCPAVICECGFLSNAEDEKLLLQESYQDEIANLIFQGVISFLAK